MNCTCEPTSDKDFVSIDQSLSTVNKMMTIQHDWLLTVSHDHALILIKCVVYNRPPSATAEPVERT